MERFPNGTRVKDSHWRVAWYTYRGGKIERALELFVDHLSRFPDSEHRTAALYWAGRAQLKLGNPIEARQVISSHRSAIPNSILWPTRPCATHRGQRSGASCLSAEFEAGKGARRPQELNSHARQCGSDARFEMIHWTTGRGSRLSRRFISLSLAAQELQYRPAYPSSRTLDFQIARLLIKAKSFHQSTAVLRRVFPDYLDLPFNALPREIWADVLSGQLRRHPPAGSRKVWDRSISHHGADSAGVGVQSQSGVRRRTRMDSCSCYLPRPGDWLAE